MVKRKCLNCQSDFETPSRFARHCSEECRRISRRNTKPVVEKRCEWHKCGKLFLTHRRHQRFCGKRCVMSEYSYNYAIKNPEALKRYRAKHLAKTVEKRREWAQQYRLAHYAERRAYERAYYAANKAKWQSHKLARRAREKTPIQEQIKCSDWMHLTKMKSSHICYYCKKRFCGSPHFDHVIALALGGKHELGNLCVSCPKCNRTKAARSLKTLSGAGGQGFLI